METPAPVLKSRTRICSCAATGFLCACAPVSALRYPGNGGRLRNRTPTQSQGGLGHFSILQVSNLDLGHDYYSAVDVIKWPKIDGFFPTQKKNKMEKTFCRGLILQPAANTLQQKSLQSLHQNPRGPGSCEMFGVRSCFKRGDGGAGQPFPRCRCAELPTLI